MVAPAVATAASGANNGGLWQLRNAMFYKGWLLPAERSAVKEYIVVCTNPSGDEPKEQQQALPIPSAAVAAAASAAAIRPSTPTTSRENSLEQSQSVSSFPKRTFYMVRKEFVSCKQKFVAQPYKSIDLCTNDKCPGCSRRVHVVDKSKLIELSMFDVKKIMLNVGNGVVSDVDIDSLEITAGLLFCCTLLHLGLIHACSLRVCQFNTVCKGKSRCLCIHQRPAASREIRCPIITPEFLFSTPIRDVSPLLSLDGFPEVLAKLGIETVGDLQVLSNAAFEHAAQNGLPQHALQWTFLQQFREIDESKPLIMVAQQFPGITDSLLATIPHSLATVECLLNARPRQVYSYNLAPRILDALEKIRMRVEPDGPAYSTISLSSMPVDSFFVRMANKVTSFRESHAHKSWRKQDATRPIVTSLITYVDDTACKCFHEGADMPKSPGKGMLSPFVGASRTRNKNVPAIEFPFDNSWCRCARLFELAVNYELSTPSGSRCSEQNCLGKLASMGVPTHAIREVFVHGDTHNGDDPNPLFPCGVCENMFRRITHDVQKKYGGEVQLFMFDAVCNPRKLVCLPVQEISHREGASFKRFVEEDLKDRLASEVGMGDRMTS